MAGISRRAVLITGAVGAGLVVGWSLLPTEYDNPVRAAPDDALFNTYLRLTPSGSITISIPVLDFGLGESTLLAQIIAQEMGADWRTIAVEPATPSAVYANMTLLRRWAPIITPQDFGAALADSDFLLRRYADQTPFMITGQAATLANYLEPCRNAGAGARVMLAQAAAARWGIDWEQCTVANNFVAFEDKRLSFAELASEAVGQPLPDILPLNADGPGEPDYQTTFGQREANSKRTDYPRLDLPAKVDGSANFAADIRLPEMLYAASRQGPLGNSKLKSFDTEDAREITAVTDVIEQENFVAVLATNWWAANQGLAAGRAEFISAGPLADTQEMQQSLDTALSEGKGYRLTARGEVGDFAAADTVVTGTYRAAPALHCTVETQCATARFASGRAEIWYAAQAPAQTRSAVADALGIAQSQVTIYPMPSGGGYGKALDHRPAVQAALLARQSECPVQLTWSRGEEQVQTLPRPPALIQLAAKTKADGSIDAMHHKIAAPAAGRQTMDRALGNEAMAAAMANTAQSYDRHMIAGALAPYAIPNISIDHHPVDLPLPGGMMRGDSEALNCFARECFMDELARKAGREPLSYRIQMLGKAPSLVACLSQAATMTGWDGGSENSGQGLACHEMQGAMIAVIASAQRGAGGVRVTRLSAAVDVGHVINPDIALQQIEYGICEGLAHALGGSSDYDGGVATSRHLQDYSLPLLNETPKIEIYIMRSKRPTLDADTIGIPAIAPAIANALFSATGFRFRQLPLI